MTPWDTDATAMALSNTYILAVSWIDRLLGLSRLKTDDDGAHIGFVHPLPLWVWVMIALGALAAAGWGYSRLIGPRPLRIGLSVLRAMIVVAIIALLCGPVLVVEDDDTRRDWLLVLVDRSASLQIRDVLAEDAAPPQSRDAAMREALARQLHVFDDDKLGEDRRIVWLAFDGATTQIDSPAPNEEQTDINLPAAEGQSTAIRTAIEQALQRAAGQPIGGVVLLTDGRSPQATGADLVARLKQLRVGVFPVPLGSTETPLNFTLARVDAPQRAFINDRVPVTVTLDKQPADADADPSRLTVRLIDQQTGKVLDEAKPTDGLDKPLRLATQSKLAGNQTWRVEVRYDAPGDAPLTQRELVTDDNHEDLPIELVDRPIRVLYIEGYPRWEYRFLKTLLIREESIDSSMMLLTADREFAQEGNTRLTRLPISRTEFEPYDVIIIGDVPANYFSGEQLALMRDHVSSQGAGVIWLAGSYFTPSTYDNTPLADLLPMRRPSAAARIDPALGPIAMRPMPAAAALNVLRLRSDPSAEDYPDSDDAAAWPQLPPFLWAQDIGTLKPTAETLAGSNQLGGKSHPLVSRIRYGGGQAVYLATDETWRWRFGRGEIYFQQFWVQLARMIARQRLQQRDDAIYLELSNRRVQLDQTITLTLHVRDALLLQRNLSRITVAVTRAAPGVDPAGRVLDRIDLVPSGDTTTDEDGRTVGRQYTATWKTSVAGDLLLRIVEAGLDDLDIGEALTVIHPDDERRQPATDHARLEQLAADTGGRVIPLNDLAQLVTYVPSRAEPIENDRTEPLWHSPLALFVIVTLITLEWVGRKVIRLV